MPVKLYVMAFDPFSKELT